MMKQVRFTLPLRMFALIFGLLLSVCTFAQQITVKGHVKDATGEPVIGATVRVEGQQGGAVTDFDGNFVVKANPGTKLTISYIGYQNATVAAGANLEIVLKDDAQTLSDVVVIGYGAVKKSDLTGSVTALKPDSKNKGLVVNAQDMIEGKIAGVSVTSAGGTPGGGATIRIRGGSSLNASNDPLIVIDGVAMDNNGVKGLANPLSMVNPQDIESFNVLKDASATAIYGSRGSNGVIIITTKKGHKGAVKVAYSGSFTVSEKKKTVDVLDGDEYRAFVKKAFAGTDSEEKVLGLLGTANTDWQDLIYRTALSHDHNVTVSGSLGDHLPYRVSLGYTNQEGIVKTSDFERYTASLNLNPNFLDNHLTLNLNAKVMWAKSRYADGAAIGAAVSMDPTQDPYSYTATAHANMNGYLKNFGGYFEWPTAATYTDSTWPYTKYKDATSNPLAILSEKNDRAISRDFIGSADIDYKVHGFEDLRLHVTAGADISQGTQTTDVAGTSPLNIYYGSYGYDRVLKRNLQLSMYAQYYKDFTKDQHFDIMAGYEWQHFWRKQHNSYWGLYPETNTNYSATGNNEYQRSYYNYATENYLVSFFGRANWILMNRYYLTATVRDDGSSRFKDHWAIFPSFAFAWRMKDEYLFKDIKHLSDLKLRLGWGMTGQQEGIGDYNYFATYGLSTGTNGFYPLLGDGTLARPTAYDPDLKWETTTTYNVGLDLGFFDQRLTAAIDWYFRKTTDLLNTVYVSAGSNFRNQLTSNIGSLKNTGVEVALSWKAIQAKDWYWTLDYNFTYNDNKITRLTNSSSSDYKVVTGDISAGTGLTAQAHAVGHAASSFYVYQQVYDKNGKAIEGQVVDRNGDGVISAADKYYYKNPTAPVTMGLSSRLEYKNWDFGFSWRASIGNYVFNDMMSGRSNVSTTALFPQSTYLSNIPSASVADMWQSYDETSTLSDRWVQNASFLKLDNVTLGYSFDRLFKTGTWGGLSGRVYGTVSNVLTITNYDGIDPEVFGGIDNNIYPRPISFILGVNLNF